ncbi:hypothetical protein WJT74_07020 [Sphingomicrobium sp. XHP0239]|uniref:hypothetical protein n=1 Tax=Sphingomicrobium maritimum TaxID=3133972 RepID=UPI0031CC5C45
MKKIAFTLLAASAFTLAACAGESEEDVAADDTIVDESYDENADSLDDTMADMPEIDEPVVSDPTPPATPEPEMDENDVMAEDPETEEVLGM